MKKLWIKINGLNAKAALKNKLYLVIWIFVNAVIGAAAWLVLGRLYLSGVTWLLCFMGYPAIFVGLFGGILYLYNHEFA